MGIRNLKLSNFKSFNEIDVTLGDLNIIVGANASGKSNFIQIFKFLKDIVTDGLDSAISLQGGIEYLKNVKLANGKNFSIEFEMDGLYLRSIKNDVENHFIILKNKESSIRFELRSSRKSGGSEFISQYFKQSFDIIRRTRFNDEKLTEGFIELSLSENQIKNDKYSGKPTINLKPPLNEISKQDILNSFYFEQSYNNRDRLIIYPQLPQYWLLINTDIYDFDPKLSQQPSKIAAKSELDSDGKNLTLVLKKILEDEDKKRKFLNLIEDILPFIKETSVEKYFDTSLLITITETYSEAPLPAILLSDGTINIIALIIALYFEANSIILIEEPDRYIHPSLIPKIMELIKDASKSKQVIITTHNPEMVRYAALENLFLIYRNEEGFSDIIKPIDKPMVNKFLQNNVSKEELFMQNLLGE